MHERLAETGTTTTTTSVAQADRLNILLLSNRQLVVGTSEEHDRGPVDCTDISPGEQGREINGGKTNSRTRFQKIFYLYPMKKS